MTDRGQTAEGPPTAISVIVISFNTADLIGPCLASVREQRDVATEIVVVDNASEDGSATHVGREHPDVRLMANRENRGFAAANNQALRCCRGRYVLFLNPDARLVPGALNIALSWMEAHPSVGLAGLCIANPDGTPQESVSFAYPGERHTRGEVAGLPGRIACVLGAAMIARASCLAAVGGFDEGFFLYGEDQDLCLRLRRQGFEIGFVPEAVAIHVGGQSERGTATQERWARKLRAEEQFYRRHYRPDTVRRIRRQAALQAWWRIWTLRLTLPFAGPASREKLERYRAVAAHWKTSRDEERASS